jgi:hypothetical protein
MKIFKFLQVAFAVAVLSVSCRVTEIIDPEFEIPGLGGHEFSETDLDLWLEETFLEPYNIEVLYRWDAVQIYSDVTHKLIPIKTELVRPMMQTLANIWFEPIVEVA